LPFKAVYTSGSEPPVLYLLTLQILENEQGVVKPFLLTEVGDMVNMFSSTLGGDISINTLLRPAFGLLSLILRN
jgi:hypothetical protein